GFYIQKGKKQQCQEHSKKNQNTVYFPPGRIFSAFYEQMKTNRNKSDKGSGKQSTAYASISADFNEDCGDKHGNAGKPGNTSVPVFCMVSHFHRIFHQHSQSSIVLGIRRCSGFFFRTHQFGKRKIKGAGKRKQQADVRKTFSTFPPADCL